MRLLTAMWMLFGATAVHAQDARFVLEIDPGYVVLSQEPDAAWGRGEPRVIAGDALSITTFRAVERARLPVQLRASLEERWVSYDGVGPACEGELGEPVLIRLVDARWIELPERGDEAVFAEGNEAFTYVLAAPFATRCERTGTWAHPIARAPSEMFVPSRDYGRAEGEALAAYRALPEYAEIAARYREWQAEEASEEELPVAHEWIYYDGAEPTFEAFVDPRDGRELVLVHVSAGSGCGGFVESLWAAFTRASNGALAPIARGSLRPIALIEVNGALEPITYDAIVGLRELQREPWFCPC
jgi:hypothetical protein